jgi:hypothetical protein
LNDPVADQHRLSRGHSVPVHREHVDIHERYCATPLRAEWRTRAE